MTLGITGAGTIANRRNQADMVNVGKLAGEGFLTIGEIAVVKDVADTAYTDFQARWPLSNRFTDIASALTATRSGIGDVVLLCPKDTISSEDSAPWTPGANVDLTKSRVKLLGATRSLLDVPGIVFSTAHAVRIGVGATAGAPCIGVELGWLAIASVGTAVIHSLEIGDSTGKTRKTYIHDCLIANVGTPAAIAEIKDFGKSLVMRDCIIGNAAVAHPDDNYLQGAGAGAVGPTIFDNVFFNHKAAAAGDQFCTIVTGALGVLFKGCQFNNVSATAMTVAVAVADDNGARFHDCFGLAYTTLAATGKGIFSPTLLGVVATDNIINPGTGADAVAPVAS